MGHDKGLLVSEGLTWVEALQQELTSLPLPVYASIRADQQHLYQAWVPKDRLIVDQAWEGVAGPLIGILSAAQVISDQHLLVVPCDMPQLRREVFARWVTAFQNQAVAYQAFISQTTRRWQPLCGIYHRDGLDKLAQYYQQGRLQNQSMQAIVEKMLVTFAIDIPTSFASQFTNYNTPHDLS